MSIIFDYKVHSKLEETLKIYLKVLYMTKFIISFEALKKIRILKRNFRNFNSYVKTKQILSNNRSR